MSEVGDRLKEERERLGKNQEDFGALGGVARNAQSNYEKGKRQPDAGYLSAIADAGADVLYIVTGIHSNTSGASTDPDETELLSLYRRCTRISRQHLLAAASAFADLGRDSKGSPGAEEP